MFSSQQDSDYQNLFYHAKVNRYALPVCFIIAYLFQLSPALRTLTFLMVRIPLHEFGHALVAIMGGRLAFPIGSLIPTAGMALIGETRYPIISILVITSALLGARWGLHRKNLFITAMSSLLVLMTINFSFLMSNEALENFISFSGIAGEFVLGAVLVLSFYFPMTQRYRWDFWRYPILLAGALSFTHAYVQWTHIKNRLWPMPMGTAVSVDGAQDPNGDLNRLLANGWSENLIIESYLKVGKLCLLLIFTHYLVFFILAPSTAKTDEPEI